MLDIGDQVQTAINISQIVWIASSAHEKGPMQFADNTGPDQPARMRRLIWACVVRLQNQYMLWYMSTNRDCPGQTAPLRMLI